MHCLNLISWGPTCQGGVAGTKNIESVGRTVCKWYVWHWYGTWEYQPQMWPTLNLPETRNWRSNLLSMGEKPSFSHWAIIWDRFTHDSHENQFLFCNSQIRTINWQQSLTAGHGGARLESHHSQRQRQADLYEAEASLIYTESSTPAKIA